MLSDDAKRLGMTFATAESCQEVRIVDLESGSVLLKIPCAHAQEKNAAMIRLSPDGTLAMTATVWNQTRSVTGRMGSFASTTWKARIRVG